MSDVIFVSWPIDQIERELNSTIRTLLSYTKLWKYEINNENLCGYLKSKAVDEFNAGDVFVDWSDLAIDVVDQSFDGPFEKLHVRVLCESHINSNSIGG